MKVYIETYGCQMNEYDSRVIQSLLIGAGHEIVERPEDAHAVVVNTCAVRERAERRVMGRLRHLRGLIGSDAVLGVVGCVAQRLGEALLKDVRGLSFVVGTDQYARLPEILSGAAVGRRSAETGLTHDVTYRRSISGERASLSEFVSVMRGCNNFCTYCIVPYVRGRERSRRPEDVLREVRALVEAGTREVTLIGQNVNSYRHEEMSFANLLESVSGVPGLLRVRFATSHPKDLSAEIIDCVARSNCVCEHIHLPMQSGSDRVLNAMNRSYSSADYAELVNRIRGSIPEVAVTTDIIVGFPGETDAEFQETLTMMETLRFDSAFMFRYSVRDGTRAADLRDDVPETAKIERLEQVIALQRRVTEGVNRELEGKTCEVLVEGPSQKDPSRLFGRTRTGKAVVFPGPAELAGSVLRVRVVSASAWTLHGAVVGEGLAESPCEPDGALLD
ncbi:MAG: tRNA (N6-isopentenyl adenosine(37)-C2)-methylthiotransferase MiaB [Candidatus Eisenbacteria bacterium]|nr:tRNA (N6-isopentenyl adenosine(37)-C2)-methylthiotransferase MiaB [Candidatus Eisenbacteria bacterium]